MAHARNFLLYLWAASIALISALSLQPGIDVPGSFANADKVWHFVAYAWLGLLPALGIRSRKGMFAATVAVVFLGGLLEVAQGFVPGRMSDPFDMLANATGAIFGAYTARSWLASLLGFKELA